MITVGKYLLDTLYSHGVEHIFGVPGDYILRLDKLIEEHSIQFINTTRENTAGYMADAYARYKGLGAACITYGVGVNIVNAVSQAFMESSPLVIISGAPGQEELAKSHHLHHLIHKSTSTSFYNTQLEFFREITVCQEVLSDADLAPMQIQKALKLAHQYKKPVYIEIPRNQILAPISPTFSSDRENKHEEHLQQALRETEKLLSKAKRPVIWLGHEILRHGLSSSIKNFIEKQQIPFVTSLLGKTVLDETHPLFAGVYQGQLSRPELCAFMDKTDFALILGVILSDFDTGLFTAKLDYEKKVLATSDEILIGKKTYRDLSLTDFIQGLESFQPSLKDTISIPKPSLPFFEATPNKKIEAQKIFDCLQKYISDELLIVSDIGDCLFGSSDLVLPQNSFLACAYFATLGFGVPGALGAELALKNKRPIALVGDGAFQISGVELSTAARYGLKPIVIVLNNQGYGTERPLLEGSYNDIQDWKYAEFPHVFGVGKGVKVFTEDGFEMALKEALASSSLFLIDVELDKTDFTSALKRFGKVMGKNVS